MRERSGCAAGERVGRAAAAGGLARERRSDGVAITGGSNFPCHRALARGGVELRRLAVERGAAQAGRVQLRVERVAAALVPFVQLRALAVVQAFFHAAGGKHAVARLYRHAHAARRVVSEAFLHTAAGGVEREALRAAVLRQWRGASHGGLELAASHQRFAVFALGCCRCNFNHLFARCRHAWQLHFYVGVPCSAGSAFGGARACCRAATSGGGLRASAIDDYRAGRGGKLVVDFHGERRVHGYCRRWHFEFAGRLAGNVYFKGFAALGFLHARFNRVAGCILRRRARGLAIPFTARGLHELAAAIHVDGGACLRRVLQVRVRYRDDGCRVGFDGVGGKRYVAAWP